MNFVNSTQIHYKMVHESRRNKVAWSTKHSEKACDAFIYFYSGVVISITLTSYTPAVFPSSAAFLPTKIPRWMCAFILHHENQVQRGHELISLNKQSIKRTPSCHVQPPCLHVSVTSSLTWSEGFREFLTDQGYLPWDQHIKSQCQFDSFLVLLRQLFTKMPESPW